jgi:hypothetical protein
MHDQNNPMAFVVVGCNPTIAQAGKAGLSTLNSQVRLVDLAKPVALRSSVLNAGSDR